jgi:hypothetical protein
MKDSDIEDGLRRYRPTGPSARLRERILSSARPQRIWPWATAAAALLVSGVTLHFAIGHEAAGIGATLGPAAETRVADDLTDRLGGGAHARELAGFILAEQQVLVAAPVGDPQ